MRLTAPQRVHGCPLGSRRDRFDALRGMARAGAGWRLLPHAFPSWAAVSPQTRRRLDAGVFAASAHGIALEVVKLPAAKRGVVLLPRRWVVERDYVWMTRLRRLVGDDERLPATLAGLHLVAFVFLMLPRIVVHGIAVHNTL